MESKLRRWLAVPVVLVAVGLGACGSSNKSASNNSTTSTSEAESPVGDKPENTEFCAEYVQEMKGIQSSAQALTQAGQNMSQNPTDPAAVQQAVADMQAAANPMATAFDTLATDAPTEIQPQFEKVASGLSVIASGTLQEIPAASADVTAAMPQIQQFMAEACKDVDLSGLTDMLDSSSGFTGTSGGSATTSN